MIIIKIAIRLLSPPLRSIIINFEMPNKIIVFITWRLSPEPELAEMLPAMVSRFVLSSKVMELDLFFGYCRLPWDFGSSSRQMLFNRYFIHLGHRYLQVQLRR